MTTWMGNHDIPRAIHYASRQVGNCWEGSHADNSWTDHFRQPEDAAPYDRLALSFAVMMTTRGIPLLYYGDEIGLAGGGDPDNRRRMPWGDEHLNEHQVRLRDKVTKLARARANNRVLSRGNRRTLHADQDVWVYQLEGCATSSPNVVVALNRGDASRQVDVPAGAYVDLMTDAEVQGGQVELWPRTFIVWRAVP